MFIFSLIRFPVPKLIDLGYILWKSPYSDTYCLFNGSICNVSVGKINSVIYMYVLVVFATYVHQKGFFDVQKL